MQLNTLAIWVTVQLINSQFNGITVTPTKSIGNIWEEKVMENITKNEILNKNDLSSILNGIINIKINGLTVYSKNNNYEEQNTRCIKTNM